MELNFENVKEVFVKNKINYNNLLQFCNKCHRLKDLNESLQLVFQISLFPILAMIFERGFWVVVEEFLKSEGGFSQEKIHQQKPLLFL